MGAHQHVGMQRNVMAMQCVVEQRKVVAAIFVIDEHSSAIHPALGDMQRRVRQFETRATWHAGVSAGRNRQRAAATGRGVSENIASPCRELLLYAAAHSERKPAKGRLIR